MGIWTLCIGIFPYLSPIICGIIAQYSSWRWMQWLTFFWWCSLLVPCAFLPETLYHRNYDTAVIPTKHTFLQRIRWKKFEGNLTYKTFLRPFVMLKYPSIFIPVFYYGNMYGFCVFGGLSVLPYVSTVLASDEQLIVDAITGLHIRIWLQYTWRRSCSPWISRRYSPR